ncbi:MAG: type B 50S ribosomal protein L31 [Candidatus Omnitrophota bacterium]
MKKDIHPNYRKVVFKDVSCDFSMLTRSTVKTGDKIKHTDGQEYPLVTVQVSSASHPFFTGKEKLMDTAGRIDRFKKKFGGKVVGEQKKAKAPVKNKKEAE